MDLNSIIKFSRSSYCGTMETVVSWEHRDTGSIPDLAQWVKNPALPQLWLRLKLRLRSDPWPGNSICHGVAKKRKKKKSLYRQLSF